MSNIFQKIGVGIEDVGSWFNDAVKAVVGVASKIKAILESGKQLEQPFINGVSTIVADVESLIALSESAVTSGAVNFPADSAAYNEFLKLVNDFKSLIPVVEQDIETIAKSTGNI